jgi:hypothetical protein
MSIKLYLETSKTKMALKRLILRSTLNMYSHGDIKFKQWQSKKEESYHDFEANIINAKRDWMCLGRITM